MKNTALPKGISKLPSGKFRVNIMVSGQRFTNTYSTLAEAKDTAVNIRRQAEKSSDDDAADESVLVQSDTPASSSDTKEPKKVSPVTPSSINTWTLQEAIERTFQVVWAGLPSERTNMFNTQAAIKFFGTDCLISRITLDRIDEYVNYCQCTGNSNGTINKKLSCLSRVLRTAHERGKLKNMPKIPLKKEPQNRIRFLSEDEEKRLLNTLAVFGYLDQRDAVECLLYTGFRCSELWRLEKRDVDFIQGTITLWKTKGGRPRTVPIVNRIRPILVSTC